MAVFSSGDTVNAIVADIGSWATKVGFAGEDYPRAYFRSNVAVLREDSDESSSSSLSKKRRQFRRRRRCPIQKVHYDSLNRPLEGESDGNWEICNPVNRNTGLWYDPNPHVSSEADWADLIPAFLRHGYESSLGLKDTKTNPLLLVERSFNPPPLRQQLLEIIMEELEVPATFFGRDATLACYACGRTTSTVIDFGYHGTTVTPVYEGYVEQKGIRRTPIGTLAMDELVLKQLQTLLQTPNNKNNKLKPLYQVRNPNLVTHPRKEEFHRLALLQIARECRESGAGQSINTAASKSLQVPSIGFTLPDGETLDIPSQNRFAVAEFVMGRSTSTTTTNEEEDVPKERQDAVAVLKKEYQSILLTATNDDDNNNYDDDDDDDDGDEQIKDANKLDKEEENEEELERQKEQASKYTEATAVGVSSRRTSRGGLRVPAVAEDKKMAASSNNKPRKVRFDNRVLQRACSSYLQSHMEQLTASPIAGMVCDAAFRCDRDQQASVLGNVVLCGGGACIGPTDQAVPDSLRDQIESIIHTHTPGWRVKVLSPSMQERAICSWLGGSILGSLGTFHEMWITKADYEEWGSSIINRKCP